MEIQASHVKTRMPDLRAHRRNVCMTSEGRPSSRCGLQDLCTAGKLGLFTMTPHRHCLLFVCLFCFVLNPIYIKQHFNHDCILPSVFHKLAIVVITVSFWLLGDVNVMEWSGLHWWQRPQLPEESGKTKSY